MGLDRKFGLEKEHFSSSATPLLLLSWSKLQAVVDQYLGHSDPFGVVVNKNFGDTMHLQGLGLVCEWHDPHPFCIVSFGDDFPFNERLLLGAFLGGSPQKLLSHPFHLLKTNATEFQQHEMVSRYGTTNVFQKNGFASK